MKRVEVNYVVGLIFDEAGTKILLIKKNKPKDLAGMLNGIGGKIEPNESVKSAVMREVWEEAGWKIVPQEWEYFLKLTAYYVDEIRGLYFFRTFQPKIEPGLFEQKTAEELFIVPVGGMMGHKVVPNLRWIVPLALDRTIVFPVQMEDNNHA